MHNITWGKTSFLSSLQGRALCLLHLPPAQPEALPQTRLHHTDPSLCSARARIWVLRGCKDLCPVSHLGQNNCETWRSVTLLLSPPALALYVWNHVASHAKSMRLQHVLGYSYTQTDEI